MPTSVPAELFEGRNYTQKVAPSLSDSDAGREEEQAVATPHRFLVRARAPPLSRAPQRVQTPWLSYHSLRVNPNRGQDTRCDDVRRLGLV